MKIYTNVRETFCNLPKLQTFISLQTLPKLKFVNFMKGKF